MLSTSGCLQTTPDVMESFVYVSGSSGKGVMLAATRVEEARCLFNSLCLTSSVHEVESLSRQREESGVVFGEKDVNSSGGGCECNSPKTVGV